MTRWTRLLALIVLLAGPGAQPARAQSFGPPVPTELVLVLLSREGDVRFTLSGYFAEWENPFRVSVRTFSDLLNRPVTDQFRLIASTPASPLIEGKYVLNRRWSLGFWYNPIRGERLQQTVPVAEKFVQLNLGRDTDLADVHVIYAAARGLTAQLGYYHEHGVVSNFLPRPVLGTTVISRNYTLVSWNFWLTQRLDVFTRDRLRSAPLDAQLVPFISFGYHPSTGLNHAASLLAGVALTFGQQLSLSGSIWLFDLTHSTATRITVGLVYQH